MIAFCRVGGKSNVNDFTLAAEACLPIICAVVAEIKKKTYPRNCFLNIDVPTDVANHQVRISSSMKLLIHPRRFFSLYLIRLVPPFYVMYPNQ